MTKALLLIAPEAAAEPLAEALRQHLGLEVEVAPNRRAGMASLRRREYELILLEESLTAADPEAANLLYKSAANSLLLEINFVLSNTDRVVRQVRAALTRRAQDRERARTDAAAGLQSELNAALAGLLLESQLALRNATPEQQPKLRHVVELASGLRDRLRI